MSDPYRSRPASSNTDVEIARAVADESGPIKVIVIKNEVESPKKGGYGTTYFMVGALFVAWCIIGTVAKNWMLKATAPAYQNTKEVRNHPWISKLALNQQQIDTSIEFTRQFEACENNTFITAGWDALVLYRAKMRLNKTMGVGESHNESVETETVIQPRGLEVTKVHWGTQAWGHHMEAGVVITDYNGQRIRTIEDLNRAKEEALDSRLKSVELTWHYPDGETFTSRFRTGKIGINTK